MRSSSSGARTCAGAGLSSASSSCSSAAPSPSPTSTSGCRRRDLDHRAACARGRAAARGEGSVRHRRDPDDVRLGGLRRPRPTRHRGRRAPARGRPAGRTSARPTCTSSPTASPRRTCHYGTVPNPAAPGRTSGGSSGGSAAALVTGRGRRSARHRHRRLDPDPGRLLRHRGLQAVVRARADRRRLPARAELRPRRADGARRRGLRRAAAGAGSRLRRPRRSRRSRRSRSASPGSTAANRSSAHGCEAVAQLFPQPRRRSTSRPPRRSARRSCARSATSTASSTRRTATCTARTSPARSSGAWRSPTASTHAAQQARRRARRARSGRARGLRPAAHTDPGVRRAACRRRRARDSRHASRSSRSRSTLSAGRPWRLPCGTAEDGLPASAQIVGRTGADALVLAAGLTLEGALKP